jgi:protein required for attachment to host cells
MKRLCIAAVDATRARLYTFAELEGPTGTQEQELSECVDLVNPERRQTPGQILSDTRPGTGRAPTGRGFAFDDHREEHLRELDRRFAAEIAQAVKSLAAEHACRHVILTASPRMLGPLRESLAPLIRDGITLDEVARDLVRLTPAQIHDALAERGLMPSRARANAAR